MQSVTDERRLGDIGVSFQQQAIGCLVFSKHYSAVKAFNTEEPEV
jgi:hypothetical protein